MAYAATLFMAATLLQELQGKRFGLVLSAGFFGFYGHAGFLSGLEEAGLAPSAFAGTSAGGLVSAFAAAGLSAGQLRAVLLRHRKDSFWDPDLGGAVWGALKGGPGATGLLGGKRFRGLLERELPVDTFEKCPRPLLLVAADLTHGKSVLFQGGSLAPRVQATCAYPGLFRAVEVDGAVCWDGGLVDKAPVLALAESRAGRELDAILVHYLPGRDGGAPLGPLAFVKGMDAAMAGLRHEHFLLQLRALAGRLPVHVVVSTLPPVTPSTLEKGGEAAREGHRSAVKALGLAPVPFAG